MATSTELSDRIEKLTLQLNEMKKKERGQALKDAQGLVTAWGIGASELNFPSTKKAAVKRARPQRAPVYRQPKTGDTWNGWGKPPKWIPKDKSKREKFLIEKPAQAVAVEPPTAAPASAPAKTDAKAVRGKPGPKPKTPKAAAVPAKSEAKAARGKPGPKPKTTKAAAAPAKKSAATTPGKARKAASPAPAAAS